MQRLFEGIHQFRTQHFPRHREFFERLAQGQKPQAVFITCSDSRVNPNLITQTEPGDLFIQRNAGNIIPPHGVCCGEAATLEYAITVLGVRDIIVCGHKGCGAMKALLEPSSLSQMPAVRAWLAHADSTARIVADNYAHLDEAARWSVAVEENVLVQIENMRTHPVIASAVTRNELRIHGWVYKIETGEVFGYNTETEQFELLETIPGAEAGIGPRHTI